MRLRDVIQLGTRHLREAIAGELMIRTGIDLTRPVFVSGIVLERCNARCLFCDDWRQDHYDTEIDIDEWKTSLTSLREFIGPYMINFSGGEPLIKRDILNLFAWCRDNGIRWGVVTNGSRLTRDTVEKLIEARPFNINISIDGLAPIHDDLRGFRGLFTRCESGIRLLREEAERAGTRFPIIVKPTVTARNFRELPDLVRWTAGVGATAVNFQPLHRSTPETYGDLWIAQRDLDSLRAVIDELLELKRTGYRILNSDQALGAWPAYFEETRTASDRLEKRPSKSVLQHFKIWVDGTVYLSDPSTPIGDLKTTSAEEIWRSPMARERRRQLVRQGNGQHFLNARFSEKTLRDKMRMAFTLFSGRTSINTTPPDTVP